MSLLVFPFKQEDLSVVETNLAIAAAHPRITRVWAVAATEGEAMSAVGSVASTIPGAPIEVFAQERIGVHRAGKGDAMNTAIHRAATEGFDRVHFYDADITNFDEDWIDGAENAADRGYHVVRHRFPRAATDAMITWMVTRPLLAMLFPGTSLPRLGQPLGGELLLTGEVIERLATDQRVSERSDWGIDTVLTYVTTAMDLPLYEHHVAGGKRHALYGSLDEIRTMVVECLDAAISLRGLPRPSRDFDADPPASVPDDLKQTRGFDLDATLPLLTAGWSDEEARLAAGLPSTVAEGLADGVFEHMGAELWGRVLSHLIGNYVPGEPTWESLAFRLWLTRVLSYATDQATQGYDVAINYLEATIRHYEQHPI